MIANSLDKVKPASITAHMNHLSPAHGGSIGRGTSSPVISNLSTFSHRDSSQVCVTHLPYFKKDLHSGWEEMPNFCDQELN